jgi:hypothetical protein
MKKTLLIAVFALSLVTAPMAFAKKPGIVPQYQGICWEFAGYKICLI